MTRIHRALHITKERERKCCIVYVDLREDLKKRNQVYIYK